MTNLLIVLIPAFDILALHLSCLTLARFTSYTSQGDSRQTKHPTLEFLREFSDFLLLFTEISFDTERKDILLNKEIYPLYCHLK